MTRSLRLSMVAIATGLAIVLTVPVMVEAGLPPKWLPLAAVVAFTAAFTANDWIMRDRRLETGPFLRRTITSNLLFVAFCAVLMIVVLPSPQDDAAPTGSTTGRSGKVIAPPAEDARPKD